ncbi:MAG: CARDB domain-containing protein [Phormidesmis sp.]
MEMLSAPIVIDMPVFAGAFAPLSTEASAGPGIIEVPAPPRVHYAPASPGIQQSSGGDLALLSFDAVDDYLSLSGTDVTFTLQNSGVAAADSFTVDIVYSQDEIIGNSDDRLLNRLIIDEIGAQDTLTRTANVQFPGEVVLPEGAGFLAAQVDTNNRVVETDESNNASSVQGVGIDGIIVDTESPTYTPTVSAGPSPTFSSFEVSFSEAVGDSAAVKSNYALSTEAGEAVEIDAVNRVDERTVNISLAAELPDDQYAFAVLSGVEDLAGNGVDAATAPFLFEIETPLTGVGDELPDESVLTQGGSYSTDVGLTASLALPGTQGVDVVLTQSGAIAAVNNETGSSLHWIDPETGAISQTVDFENGLKDIAFNNDDTLVLATGDSLLKVDATTGDVIEDIAVTSIDRVAISKDGHVGAIADKTVFLYDDDNTLLFSKTLNYTAVTDLEIRSGVGGQSVYVTSFRNTSFIDLNGQRNPVQIARLEAFDFTGQQQWSLFGDASETIKQNVADTRLYRVTLGQDGYLYIGGESAGTATIFRWRGQPMTEAEQFGTASPFLSQIDRHSQLWNSGSAHISYYARVNPLTGELEHSQLTFPRLRSSKSNTMRIGDIAASDSGTLYFGGTSFASLLNRDSITLNGELAGAYAGEDPTWMSIAPDFRTRNFWTALSDEGARGMVYGVDAGYGYSAALTNLNSGTLPVTTGSNSGSVFISFTPEPRRD